jgi:hypothetical protein
VPLALLFVNVPIISSGGGGGGIWVVTNVCWLFHLKINYQVGYFLKFF